MKIEDQCCTLEQAKKLEELGVVQESWFCFKTTLNKETVIDIAAPYFVHRYSIAKPHISAFTVAELGLLLPDAIKTNSNIQYADLTIVKDTDDAWTVGYKTNDEWYYGHGDDTLAKAMAEMLIRVIEKDKTTVEEVNQRLQS